MTVICIPKIRYHRCCDARSPRGLACTRPIGHTGRHNNSWTHMNGELRAVWPAKEEGDR